MNSGKKPYIIPHHSAICQIALPRLAKDLCMTFPGGFALLFLAGNAPGECTNAQTFERSGRGEEEEDSEEEIRRKAAPPRARERRRKFADKFESPDGRR